MLEHVTLYFCNQALGVSLALPDVFSVASQLQKNRVGQGIKIELATATGKPFKTYGGIGVDADKAIADIGSTGLVILPAVGGEIDSAFLADHETLYPKLRAWHANGTPIMAVGSANFLLAESGLLDYRMTTVNKHTRKNFSKRYPKVDVCRDRSITESDGIYTCTGADASSYVILSLLAQLSSNTLSKNIENIFSTDPGVRAFLSTRPDDQSLTGQDESILRILQWLELHFSESISLEFLADKTNMSLRTFKRRFRETTDAAPLRYIQTLRLQQAKEYLKHTDKRVAEVARLVGYDDASHFNYLFKREYAVSPGRWRKEKSNENSISAPSYR